VRGADAARVITPASPGESGIVLTERVAARMTSGGTAMVDQVQRRSKDVGARGRKRAPIADRKAREFLRSADMAELADRWRPYRSLAVSYLFASEYEL
jgi:3-methyladenine DNA glycosylase/8-oxoguanine DNA glycosylase